MRARKPIHKLAGDEEQQLVAAFAALRSSADDTTNYAYWASVHACCAKHSSAMFLPWHRAFIFTFETALRSAIGSDSLTLPYWDWVALPRLPDLLQDPVFAAERYTDEERAANHLELPSDERVRHAIEKIERFADFGGYTCTSGPGELETIHGYPHTWVGPWMHILRFSAFDPVFWFHHSNVDRLWALWQTKRPGEDPPCLDDPLVGIPENWRVRDVLQISSGRLDYEYVDTVTVFAKQIKITSKGLSVALPIPAEGRVEFRLNGVHSMSTEPGPSELLVFLEVSEQPIARLSLFGITGARHGGNDPVILPIPECPGDEHSHHTVSFRLDLTDIVAGLRGGTIGLRLMTNGGPGRGAGLSVGDISLAAVSA